MSRKIFIVRHSLTDWNVKNIYQGWSDNSISEIGKGQAEKLKEGLKNEDLKIIFSSPLTRARQTAEIIANRNINIAFVDELKDISISPKFEGRSEEELFKTLGTPVKPIEDLDSKLPGGESVSEVYTRTVEWFNRTKRETRYNFLVVTHEINIQSLIFHQLGLELNLKNALAFKGHLRIRHDRLTIIEEDEDVGFYLAVNSS